MAMQSTRCQALPPLASRGSSFASASASGRTTILASNSLLTPMLSCNGGSNRHPTLRRLPITSQSPLYRLYIDKIGPAVLLTHSASGILGWLTGAANEKVKAIYSYEPVQCAFPIGEVPPPVPTSGGAVTGLGIPPADFEKLVKIPVAIIYGDNIPSDHQPQRQP